MPISLSCVNSFLHYILRCGCGFPKQGMYGAADPMAAYNAAAGMGGGMGGMGGMGALANPMAAMGMMGGFGMGMGGGESFFCFC
jgi:hypothetical protein